MVQIPERLVSVLERPNHAVMATTGSDGAPVTVATWYVWDAGRILLNLDARRSRLKYLETDPRVSLTVLDENWYRHISLKGRVTLTPDTDFSGIDRLSRHYGGHPYPDHVHPRVNAWMDIETVHHWGFGDL